MAVAVLLVATQAAAGKSSPGLVWKRASEVVSQVCSLWFAAFGVYVFFFFFSVRRQT